MLKSQVENELGLSGPKPEVQEEQKQNNSQNQESGAKQAPQQSEAPLKSEISSQLKSSQKRSSLKDSCKDDLGLSGKRQGDSARMHSASSTTREHKTPMVYTSAVEAAENSFTPGAGAYQLEHSFKAVTHKSPAFSLASKHQTTLLTNPTGPGQYNTNLCTLDHRGGEFVKSDKYPGDLKKSAVGPGSYTLRKGMENRGITLSGRHDSTSQFGTPGVGAYNVDRRDRVKNAYTLSGRSDKFMNLYAAGTTNAPGVGAYNVGERLSSHGARFTKFEYQNTKNDIPGVGSYNVAPQRSSSAGLSLSSRNKGHHF